MNIVADFAYCSSMVNKLHLHRNSDIQKNQLLPVYLPLPRLK